jgi:hypothetical protein
MIMIHLLRLMAAVGAICAIGTGVIGRCPNEKESSAPVTQIKKVKAMDLNLFWQLIADSKKNAKNQGDQIKKLRQLVTNLSPQQIIEFDKIVWGRMAKSYHRDLWLAFYVIRGGCSDDSFDYCRQWLILRGREVFDRALKNPDSLADLDNHGECEELLSLAWSVYEAKMGKKIPGTRYADYGLQGQEWDESDEAYMKKKVPNCFRKFW